MIWSGELRAVVRRAGMVIAVMMCLVALTACGGNGDEDPDEDPTIDETAIPSGPTSTPEPEPEPDVEPTATATMEPTSTPEATATATPSPTPEPPTATPTITPSPTPTPLPTVDLPFEDVRPLTEEIPNFTLSYSARYDGPAEDDGAVDLLIEQASPESYHLRVATGDQQTEAWRSGEAIYVLGPGGAVVELPGLVDQNLYAPSSFLVLVPELEGIESATVLGENVDVGGRSTTHYGLDPDAASGLSPTDSDAGGDVEGTFEVWVDDELGVIVQMDVDVEWSSAGADESLVMDYLLSNIGSTPEAQPPL